MWYWQEWKCLEKNTVQRLYDRVRAILMMPITFPFDNYQSCEIEYFLTHFNCTKMTFKSFSHLISDTDGPGENWWHILAECKVGTFLTRKWGQDEDFVWCQAFTVLPQWEDHCNSNKTSTGLLCLRAFSSSSAIILLDISLVAWNCAVQFFHIISFEQTLVEELKEF